MLSAGIMSKTMPLMRQGARQMSVVSGPPRVKISTGEKVVHAAVMVTAVLSIPAWVLVNIKNYRAKN